MQITFWGAARTVTGSQHLLQVEDKQVLLDCGLYQGRRAEAYEINRQLPFDARQVDAMILSHAHIDHSGNIPSLSKNGYRGQIICTHATRDLCAVMLRDSGSIQENDINFLNRHNKNTQRIEPIYTLADAEQALRHFVSYNYDQAIAVQPGISLKFSDAGHMLGSSWEALELNEAGRNVRLCFSGDLGRTGLPILRDPQPMPEADYLIMESTYGDRLHDPIADALPELERAINDTVRRGGKVIVPAFAVGRTQELVYFLNELILAGKLPNVPVYIDSPLAINVTEAFRTHPECYDEETKAIMRTDPDGDVFGFRRASYTRAVEQSKAINTMKGPAIIISASGMCENGRILHHLRNNIEDSRNMILFVSYQGNDTLGGKILSGQQYVNILGDSFTVRAEVRRIEAFSGHADRNDLLNWVKPQAKNLKGVFLVHGDLQAAKALAEGLQEIGVRQVSIPARGDTVILQ